MGKTEGLQKKSWSRGKRWAVGFVVVFALVEVTHAGWSFYDASDASGHADGMAGQSWANLKRCLIGDAAGDTGTATGPLARLRRGLAVAEPEARLEGAAAFPQRCAPHAGELSDALGAAGQWVFVEQVERVRAALVQGAVADDLDMLWISLEGLVPLRDADASIPLPPKLPTELVPLAHVSTLGDESVAHTVREGDPSNGGPLTIRFEKTHRTCMFAEDLRSARCLFDHDSLPDTLFRSPRVGSSAPDGAPWLSFRHIEGERLYDVTTGELLRSADERTFFGAVLATHGAHWILERKPKKQLVRRNAGGDIDTWPLPPSERSERLVGDFVLSTQSSGPSGARIVARRLPEEGGELGPVVPIVERPSSRSLSSSHHAHRDGETMHLIVDTPTSKLLVTFRDGKWSEMEIDDLPDRVTVSFDESAVYFVRIAPTYVEVKACREAGCQKISYEARLDDNNAAVRLGGQIALLSWDSDQVWLTVAKPEALGGARRRLLLATDYVGAARLWTRGTRALVILDTNLGALPIAFDATGAVWPVQLEDARFPSGATPATPKRP